MKPILIYDTWNNNIRKVTDILGTLTLKCGGTARACGLFWIIEEEDEQIIKLGVLDENSKEISGSDERKKSNKSYLSETGNRT